MPTYTYHCSRCCKKFELFFHITDYIDCPSCVFCSSQKTERSYHDDICSVASSIKKHDSELRTIGDLANRNRDRLSDDHKQYLAHKHNEYKQTESNKPLPKGMSRIKKPPKPKWI